MTDRKRIAAGQRRGAHPERHPMANRSPSLMLTAPSTPLFLVAVVLALAAAIAHYGNVGIPLISANVIETLLLAFGVLTAGVLMRGA